VVSLSSRIRVRLLGVSRSAGYALRSLARRRRPADRARFLLLASYDPWGFGAVRQHVGAIRALSHYDFDVLNLCALNLRRGPAIPRYVALEGYDGIFIHNTLAYNPEDLQRLDRSLPEKLADFRGLKVVMKQDEHYRIAALLQFLDVFQPDLLLTCLPPEHVRAVYPKERLPGLRFLHVRTGYVTHQMRQLRRSQDDPRPIDIGYRASSHPFAFGRLCYEKQAIGEAFRTICAERGLRADISTRPEDWRFGRAWLEFLAGCKGTLGVESGASVFDFTGQIERRCDEYLKAHPQADFETVHRLLLAPHEGHVQYRQVSPRHFEAAACRTVQILYEGGYSGVFQPGRHYLPLRRDHANLDEVLARFLDPAERKRISEAAFEEIILNDQYLYSTFVRQLDETIGELLQES
jgi:hypothetical protein